MPLRKGYGTKTRQKNFSELKKKHPEMPARQRTAIVLSTAQDSAEKAGKPSKGPGRPKRRKKS